MRRIWRVAVGVALSGACASAAGDAETERPGFHSFRVTALDRMETPLLFDSGDAELTRVLPPRGQRSARIEMFGSRRLSFFAPPKENAESTARPTVVAAEARLPPEVKRPLILFEGAPSKGAGKYNAFVIEDDWDVFPAGSVRVVNLSTLPMAARMGDTDLLIEPGAQQSVQLPREGAPTHLVAKIALKGPNGWVVDYDGVHQVVPRMRFLFVCRAVPEGEGKVGLKVALLRDFEPNSARLQR